ncbi:MAG: hypothetical protein GXP45_02565 [bacterium]|nr:hypothetical protein [bacterium]
MAAVDLLKSQNCDLFVAKRIGENMKQKLDEEGIPYQI